MSSNDYSNSAHLHCLDWSVICSRKEGETYCGDSYLVHEYENEVLIAVIDGLGHGSMAAKASKRAVNLLETFNNESLITLIKNCHNGLRDTRGVVMGLALINFVENTLAWIDVGNIDGVLLLADEGDYNQKAKKRVVQRSGIVGYNLPFLQVSMVPISVGDILIFTTDGVRNDYLEKVDVNNTPKEIVNKSMASFKTTDDSLILAARYKGTGNYG